MHPTWSGLKLLSYNTISILYILCKLQFEMWLYWYRWTGIRTKYSKTPEYTSTLLGVSNKNFNVKELSFITAHLDG